MKIFKLKNRKINEKCSFWEVTNTGLTLNIWESIKREKPCWIIEVLGCLISIYSFILIDTVGDRRSFDKLLSKF